MSALRGEFRHLQLLFAITFTFFLLLTHNALGQASYRAQVRGSVTDQSGAVVQNAKVTITNDGTGVSTSATTDEHGFYLLTGLRLVPTRSGQRRRVSGRRRTRMWCWLSTSRQP